MLIALVSNSLRAGQDALGPQARRGVHHGAVHRHDRPARVQGGEDALGPAHLFGGRRKACHHVGDLAGVEWRGLHALRHTAGTELYRATGDLYVTAELLGHRDIKTTQIYAHMSQQHLRDALRKRAG